MMDRVSLYGDVEVPPPGAVTTLALMHEYTSTLQTANNLGVLYTVQGKLDNVGQMCYWALQGYEKAFGTGKCNNLSSYEQISGRNLA
jgi:heat shock protein HslJ